MIFLTVGAQMPFDRLVKAVDAWTARGSRADVFAQIGPAGYRPKHMQYAEFLSPGEYRERIHTCRFIVAHAGMGSILTALEMGKPILVMPRRAGFAETRHDHQVATARRFLDNGSVAVAFDENELPQKLDQLAGLSPADRISPYASPGLITVLRTFIEEVSPPGHGGGGGASEWPSTLSRHV